MADVFLQAGIFLWQWLDFSFILFGYAGHYFIRRLMLLNCCSQRLKLLRKRDAVYIRSKHGLSLRRSKVLSIGGSSLKWSKSIERRSKKVNEVCQLLSVRLDTVGSEFSGFFVTCHLQDATRAVLEAQREKREQKASMSARTKKENNGSRKKL